jgi:hypothetical protein
MLWDFVHSCLLLLSSHERSLESCVCKTTFNAGEEGNLVSRSPRPCRCRPILGEFISRSAGCYLNIAALYQYHLTLRDYFSELLLLSYTRRAVFVNEILVSYRSTRGGMCVETG